jgi:hypothetical protein
VAQQCLHRPDIVALLEQIRRSAMPKGITADAFGELYRTTCLAHSLWHTTLTGMMPVDSFQAEVSRQLVRGNHVLSNPESAGLWVFSVQRKRSINRAIACS